MDKYQADMDHLAELAKLGLSEEERAMFGPQMASILAYVGKLASVDTSQVPAAAFTTDAKNVWRQDVVATCDPDIARRCLEAFPKSVGSALSVPGVFEERTE